MKKAINQESMRSNNKKSILDIIQKQAPVSKVEIANSLGLSQTSVATFIKELILEKKITGCGTAKSTGGRKSALYQINPTAFYIIGMDLQVDRLISILTNAAGKVVATTEKIFTEKNEWYVLKLISDTIEQQVHENQLSLEKIGGIGIGIPGIVQQNTGLIQLAPNLDWQNVNIRQLLNIDKPIFIENEANAAVIGEKTFGIANGNSNFLYISIGIGVGCGLILNGKLYSGHSSHAGEFGHMTVEPHGEVCSCGNQGCWEAYTSNKATLFRYNRIAARPADSFEVFIESALQNDPVALEVLETTVKYLGIGIANIVNGLNPEMVIIGGKITELQSLIYHQLLKQIKERSLAKTYSDFTLEFSTLKNQATAFGMASLALDAVFNA